MMGFLFKIYNITPDYRGVMIGFLFKIYNITPDYRRVMMGFLFKIYNITPDCRGVMMGFLFKIYNITPDYRGVMFQTVCLPETWHSGQFIFSNLITFLYYYTLLERCRSWSRIPAWSRSTQFTWGHSFGSPPSRYIVHWYRVFY